MADSNTANENTTSTSTDGENASTNNVNSSQNFVRFDALQLPLDPDVKICGVIPKQATLFKSSLMPARLTFITDKGNANGKAIIQLCSMNVIPLLSKPYVNGVTSTEQNLSLKYCQSLEQKVC